VPRKHLQPPHNVESRCLLQKEYEGLFGKHDSSSTISTDCMIRSVTEQYAKNSSPSTKSFCLLECWITGSVAYSRRRSFRRVGDLRCIHTPPGCWVCGLGRCVVNAERQNLVWTMLFIDFPRRFKKIEDCELGPYHARPPGKELQARDPSPTCVPGFKVAAMSTVGDSTAILFQNSGCRMDSGPTHL